jgi:hypothetical protein
MGRLRVTVIVLTWCVCAPGAFGVAQEVNPLRRETGLILAQTETQQPAQQAEPPPDTATPEDGTASEPQTEMPAPDSGQGTQQTVPEETDEGTSLGEIPAIETVELTPDMAKRALDAYIMVREKYKDANLEEYENLQDFVDQTDEGKKFETDIKSYGFTDVNEWNTAVTSVGVAYSSIVDDQSADIRQQIEDVKKDDTIAQDMKDRMIASLNAMIPSANNKSVVEELMKDTAANDKLKLLGEEQAEE